MKIKNLKRVYITLPIKQNTIINLEGNNCYNYIKNVLRLRINDNLRIFNNESGEYISTINNIEKDRIQIYVNDCIREPDQHSIQITIALSILKSDKFFDAINMAVQIGVSTIAPIYTSRSQIRSINQDRIQKCIIEAIEQSEQILVPNFYKLQSIEDYVNTIQNKNNTTIIFANENEEYDNDINKIADKLNENIIFIIGPEGGFTDAEIELLKSIKNCKSISLGKNILRAETATIVGLSQIHLLKKYKKK